MAKRKPYEKSKAPRKGRTLYGPQRAKEIEWFSEKMTAGEYVVVGKKHSDLFGEDIEVYGDSSLLDTEELSPYRVTADHGADLVAQINAGYSLTPGDW